MESDDLTLSARNIMKDWVTRSLKLASHSRGFHLITRPVIESVPEIGSFAAGFLHLFIQHTSASLTLNENADPDVRIDMEQAANLICPESFPFIHTDEGNDDMPAHVKASLFGNQLLIPIQNGHLALGTWQGIYLCEHRNHAPSRSLVLTLFGQLKSS